MAKTFLQSSVGDLQRTLEDVNRKMQEEETINKASQLGLQYINLQKFPIDLNVLGLFTREEAEHAESIPFYRELHDLRIATVNPGNILLAQKIKELSEKFKITLYFLSRASFEQTDHQSSIRKVRHLAAERHQGL